MLGRVILSLLVAQGLQAPRAAFPRDGAHKLLENDRVVVWDVVWPVDRSTPMLRYVHETVSVILEPGTVHTTSSDNVRSEITPKPRGGVIFGRQGVVRSERGVGRTARRAIVVELKEGGLPPMRTPAGAAPAWPRDGARRLLDNDRVVAWDYEFIAGRPVPLHFHDKDTVVVELAAGRTRSAPRSGPPQETIWRDGGVRFAPRGRLHSEEHVEGTPRGVMIELK